MLTLSDCLSVCLSVCLCVQSSADGGVQFSFVGTTENISNAKLLLDYQMNHFKVIRFNPDVVVSLFQSVSLSVCLSVSLKGQINPLGGPMSCDNGGAPALTQLQPW